MLMEILVLCSLGHRREDPPGEDCPDWGQATWFMLYYISGDGSELGPTHFEENFGPSRLQDHQVVWHGYGFRLLDSSFHVHLVGV